MEDRTRMQSSPARPGGMRRKAVSLSQESLVKLGHLDGGVGLPLVIQPGVSYINPAAWAGHNRELIESCLLRHGAILFRGFEMDSVSGFESFARAVSPELLDYRERSSPRSEVTRGIYTSTDYPADQSIHFHNEQSYTRRWPMKLWFFCARAAERGGATPIADGRRVLALLDPQLREGFRRKKVMYMRNYGYGLGLSWQSAFQTDNPADVENYCRSAAINFEWRDGGRLRTRQVFETIVTHPQTGEETWFEHAAFFHVSGLPASVRAALLAEFAEEDLPSNTYYGDGSPIEDATLEAVREAYRQAAVSFPWRAGDALLIDNMLTSHGREPFAGTRRIVVAMAELYPPQAANK
ncbi:MAG: TauD/TfdA family dioxygenase [Acidobacteria bacterium]|nr:TauD/TfdA family dioxygenase [Acidobacteriota bacterium]